MIHYNFQLFKQGRKKKVVPRAVTGYAWQLKKVKWESDGWNARNWNFHKIRDIQNCELQNRKLQGLPVLSTNIRTYLPIIVCVLWCLKQWFYWQKKVWMSHPYFLFPLQLLCHFQLETWVNVQFLFWCPQEGQFEKTKKNSVLLSNVLSYLIILYNNYIHMLKKSVLQYF